MVADKEGTVRRTLAFVGADPPDDLRVAPDTERQADELNAEWARLYRHRAR